MNFTLEQIEVAKKTIQAQLDLWNTMQTLEQVTGLVLSDDVLESFCAGFDNTVTDETATSFLTQWKSSE